MTTTRTQLVPGYWRNETSGVLRPAIEAYLGREPLSEAHIAAIRAYLRQWVHAPGFFGPEIDALRSRVDGLTTRKAISQWLGDAEKEGIDPL
jgi:hypothetical protein